SPSNFLPPQPVTAKASASPVLLLSASPPAVSGPIGLLAGWGRFPIVFAEKARAAGIAVVCVAIRGEAAPELAQLCQRFYWSRLAQLGRTLRIFKQAGVHRVAMAGKVHKANYMHKPWKLLTLLPDWRTLRVWLNRRRDNKDDTLLQSVVNEFAADGIEIAS